MSAERELDARVRVMHQEKLAQGVPCSNEACTMRSSCERFFDPARTENVDKPIPSTVRYNPDRDSCHVLRRRLTGTLEVHREWQKTTKRHRRRGGSWL